MKLRNKKTGEAIELKLIQTNCECLDEHEIDTLYGEEISLETLNKFCEDYKPKEPKLNGEVREIVRHWAVLHGYEWVRVGFSERATQTIFWVESPDTRKHIEFLGAYVADDFDAGKYTIEELCGEEEAPEPIEPTFVDLDERIKEREEK